MADRVEQLPAELDTKHLLRRVAQIALVVGVIVIAVTALPGLSDVRERFAGARPGWLAVALVLELCSVLAFVVAFRNVFCRRLPWDLSWQIATAEQAANVLLPTGGAGGLALGAWALRRGGMPTEHIARRSVAFFLLTSSVNFATAFLAGMALALGLLPGDVAVALALPPALLALAVLGVVLSLPRVLNRRAPRPPADAGRIRRGTAAGLRSIADGVGDAVILVRRPPVLLGAVGYMAFDLAALAAAFKAFGAVPPLGIFMLAYVLGQLGGLVPLPGGIGGTDGGLVGALVLYGTPLSTATAAVLAYRAFQLGVPAIIGSIGFVQLQRTLARSAAPQDLCAPLAESAEPVLDRTAA